MIVPPDPHPYLDQLISRLTARGGEFEIVMDEVLGAAMPVMRNRDRAVADLLARSHEWGDREYLVTATRRISFAEHAREAYALAAALQQLHGVGTGDRVAILSANRPEWVTAFWSTQALGAITVGLNAWWAQPELEFGIRSSAPRVLFVDDQRAEAISGLGLHDTVVLTLEEDLPRLIAEFAGARPPAPRVDEDDPAVLLYTSGTTGLPKAARFSHLRFVSTASAPRIAGYERRAERRVAFAAKSSRGHRLSPILRRDLRDVERRGLRP